ncbi:family 20 glycosylhydrolase [Pelagibacteraceae bacterium]|nr:family 20 glycosylhydrolase [Pelagibacteraceae bacterium]
MLFQINPSFTKKNQLKLNLSKNILDQNFKLCFSLVYSLKFIEGAEIIKQIGRYYELKIKSKIISITLHKTRLGTYNMSCGPEGIFLINKKNKYIKPSVGKLKFEKIIKKKTYNFKLSNNFVPIIPQPYKYKFKNDFIKIKDKIFKIQNEDKFNFKNYKFIKNTGIKFSVSKGHSLFFLKKNFLKDQYSIIISKNSIQIKYGDIGGKLYALMTLTQLIGVYKTKLPICDIEDKPKYLWRGMHLDCARQFYSIKELKRLFDYMAFFKLNKFHWHLTDNEAWRIEIKKYPQLTKIGSYRGYNSLIPPFYGSGYKKYGGFYSQKEIIELINYAKNLNIEIMPEIDIPSHSWTLLQIIPQLRKNISKNNIKDIGNYYNNTINPILSTTKSFLNDVFDEIGKIFSFDTIHIGMDEMPKNVWDGSKIIKKFMIKNKIRSENELQIYFIKYIKKILDKKNKKMAAWNDFISKYDKKNNILLNLINDKKFLIFSWENTQVAEEVINRGFETILCPGSKTYFDMAYNNSTKERGLNWANTIEVKQIFDWNPEHNIKNIKLIRGIQGQLWSETITNKKYFDVMINPRLATLSEIAWSSNKKRSWLDFRTSLINITKILRKFGWKNHDF